MVNGSGDVDFKKKDKYQKMDCIWYGSKFVTKKKGSKFTLFDGEFLVNLDYIKDMVSNYNTCIQ